MMKYALLLGGLLAQGAGAQPTSNHQFEHTIITTAAPAQVWAIWLDVAQWPRWDLGLRAASLHGPFALEARGEVIPDRGPKARFKVTAYVPFVSYTLTFGLPLGKLIIERVLSTTPNGLTSFTHRVRFTGPLRGIFGRSLGRRYRELLPLAMEQIKLLAEAQP